jgi:hypothetical protein
MLLAAICCAAVLGAASAAAVSERSGGWTSYRNAQHGFMIAWPSDVFPAEPARDSEDGQVLVSRDGAAKLMMAAFLNEQGVSLADYRRQLLEENYAGVEIDYAPVRDRWFVLSGVRDGVMFYERVTFTCGGKLINSWAMLYPAAERKRYDRIVEAVAKTYMPGAGRDGRCG